jgi:hypothetical protein
VATGLLSSLPVRPSNRAKNDARAALWGTHNKKAGKMTQRTRKEPYVSCHGLSEAAGQSQGGCDGYQQSRQYMMRALSSGMPLGRHGKRQALSTLSRCTVSGELWPVNTISGRMEN